jgi:hypothetical protein
VSPAQGAAVRAELAAWNQQRDAYHNIQDAVSTGAVSLVSLIADRPPLAQIVSGNMDTASHVTYIVPGMDTATNQDGTMQNYAAIARGTVQHGTRHDGARKRDSAPG